MEPAAAQQPPTLVKSRSGSATLAHQISLREVVLDVVGIGLAELALLEPPPHHRITFKAATTSLIAGLRLSQNFIAGRNLAYLKLNIVQSDQEFDPQLINSLAALVQSRDAEQLRQLGGLQGLAQHVRTNLAEGLPIQYAPDTSDSSLAKRKRVFGENSYPQKAGKTFWAFLWEACNDTTLIILMLCAALSLGFGIKINGLKQGWYDGASIAFAVVFVGINAYVRPMWTDTNQKVEQRTPSLL